MTQIPLPQIYLGKRKARSQMCRVYTDDGRVVKIEMDVLLSCIDHPDLGKGFLISTGNQFRKDGVSWQLLYEKSCIPICLVNDPNIQNLSKLIDQIYRQSREAAQRKQYLEAAKNTLINKILWVVSIPCTAALIFGAMTILRS